MQSVARLKHKMMRCRFHEHYSGMWLLKLPLGPRGLWAFPRITHKHHPLVVPSFCVAYRKLRSPSTWKRRGCYPTKVPALRCGRHWDQELKCCTDCESFPLLRETTERKDKESNKGGFGEWGCGTGRGAIPHSLPQLPAGWHDPFSTSLALQRWAIPYGEGTVFCFLEMIKFHVQFVPKLSH